MPGRLFLTTPVAEIASWSGFSVANCSEQKPRRNVAPGEDVVAITTGGLTTMRWGLIPVGRKNARGRPVMEVLVNARSETVFDKSAFSGVKRCLVPADGWYEWTGEKRKKQPWRISSAKGGPLAFAAIYDIWNGPGGIEVPQVATVTCEPNGDVRDIHHRMGVILFPDQFGTWLGEDQEAAVALMRPLPDGSLAVEKADDVDFSAP
ncbi:MAG: SOS response-associated peptidase [Pseudomonadota bacterium]